MSVSHYRGYIKLSSGASASIFANQIKLNQQSKFVMTPITQTGENRVYFPGLNGIRALAAISVLLAHIDEYKWRLNLGIPPMFPKVLLNGINAVIMFFVLSGFLITYLLLSEIQKTGTVLKPRPRKHSVNFTAESAL